MRDLQMNTRVIYYANPVSRTAVTDTEGYFTGEEEVTYGTPTAIRVNVAEAKTGMADVEAFGIALDYDGTIVTADRNCPITDESILWVNNASTGEHDYIVVRTAKSIDGPRYAIRRVHVG